MRLPLRNLPRLRNLLLLALATLLLDQGSKLAVVLLMSPGESILVLSDFLRLTFVRNSGAAFGLFSGNRITFLMMTFVAVAALLFVLFRSSRRGASLSPYLVLVVAGAIGNMVDRFRVGDVVDFVDIGWKNVRWPVFNVADIALTAGVILFLYHTLLKRHPSQSQ